MGRSTQLLGAADKTLSGDANAITNCFLSLRPVANHGSLRAQRCGNLFRFRFCPVCGSTVYHTEEGMEGSVGVAIGAFADPNFPPPQFSIYDMRRHSWVQLPAGTTSFAKDPS